MQKRRSPHSPTPPPPPDPASAVCTFLRPAPAPSIHPSDWPSIAATASRHGLAPALFLALDRIDPPPPVDVRATLHRAFVATAAVNMRLYAGLGLLLPALEAAGVEAIVLKGADLAARVYPTIAARPTTDLDLLVRREQVEQVTAAIEPLGYSRWAEAGLTEDHYTRWRKGREVAGEGPALPLLDLHWHLLDRHWSLRERLDLDWFWDQSEVVEAEGVRMRCLLPEAQILYLCLHVDYHGAATRLLWLYDIDRLLRATEEWRWAVLAAEVERLGCQRAVGGVLAVSVERFGTPVPGELLEWAGVERPRAERWLSGLLERGALPDNLVDLVNSLTIPDRRTRLAYLRNQLLPSPEFMHQRYGVRGRALLPLYYVYRWVRGVGGVTMAAAAWLRMRVKGEL